MYILECNKYRMVQVGNIFCTYWILDFDMIACPLNFPLRNTVVKHLWKIIIIFVTINIDLVKWIDMVNTAASCMYTNIFISFETSHSYQFKYAHSICYFLYVYNTRMKRKILDVSIHFNIKIFLVHRLYETCLII